MIVNSALGHLIQREDRMIERLFVAEALPTSQQNPQIERVRKLGGPPEPAVVRIGMSQEQRGCVFQQFPRKRLPFACMAYVFDQSFGQSPGLFVELFAFVSPGVFDRL